MATITISFPLIDERTISVPDSKLKDLSEYFGVKRSDYETDYEASMAFADAIEFLIKSPVIQARTQSAPIPDISDLITVS